MKFALAVDSRIGGRSNNEDRFAMTCSTESVLLVVADGMGGHADGEVAAQIVVDVLTQQFREMAYPRVEQPRHFLNATIADAHQAILDYAIVQRLSEVPCTTVVAAIVQDDVLYCAYAGDSRLYLLDQGEVRFRSRDHSHVQRLIDSGFLNEVDAANHPARNRIYNCLGSVGEPDVAMVDPLPLLVGTSVVLCSDGLWGVVPDQELAKVFQGRAAPSVLPVLMNVAEKRAGDKADNLTALAFTLLAADTAIDGRAGFIDTALVPGFFAEEAMQAMIMEHELSAGLSSEPKA